jgi:signal transduction histidine kinase/CheY-like chemotaxis protein
MRPLSRWSIEWKLPLGGGLILLLAIVLLASAAYREVRRSTRATAVERLNGVTTQLASLLANSTSQLASQMQRFVANRDIGAYLLDPSPRTEPPARSALTYQGNQSELIESIELWDSAGRRLLANGPVIRPADPTRDRRLVGEGSARDSTRLGDFETVGDSVRYPSITPIRAGQSSGYIVIWRAIRTSPAGRGQLTKLIGSESSLYLGNRNGTVWTDLVSRAPSPPVPIVANGETVEYTRPEGRRLAMARPITGSPWVVLVEFPSQLIEAPVRTFLIRETAIAALLWLGSLLIAWLASRSVTRPLGELTLAAEAVSAGDYSRRVQVSTKDELGRLARVYNDMAERVQDSTQRLEEKVAERTRELNQAMERLVASERQLSTAKDAAERANRAKSDFLAKMSHELRTPLNAIIGFSEMLGEQNFGPLNQKQQRYVTNVLDAGRQLLHLINDILDLSKIEAGRMELSIDEFAPGMALHDVTTVVTSLAEKKAQRIELEIEAGLPALRADQGKFKQIMYNLLSNAIKFTEVGGRVTVRARRTETSTATNGHPMLEISVTDTGIGIRPEDQVRIFQEFEQVDSAYGREQQGTGLGLALTRRLVELHGGRIEVESKVEVGSTFRFILPFDRRSTPIEVPILPSPPPLYTRTSGVPLVLVVEDEPSARELLAQQLKDAGYDVAEARNGDEAVRLAAQLKPDAITLDVLLPGRDGHEVLAFLKSGAETREIPVIVVSITENRELGLSLGAADWLVKPARREDFLGAIRRAVGDGNPSRIPSVLIVDDEPATLELLTDLLSHQQFQVHSATGGNEGIARALERPYDAIVVDLMMPEVTGFEVARRIRASPARREVPIVVFTMKDLTIEEREQLGSMVQAIVVKSRGRDALLRELEKLVRPRLAAV